MAEKLPVPVEVTMKFDGFRVQASVKDGKVKIISEDGGDVTARFPGMVREFKGRGDLVLDAEITGELKGKHMGRSKVSGYAHAKTPADDGPYTMNVFDVLYAEGKDFHKEPMTERRASRLRMKSGEKVKIEQGIVAETDSELQAALKKQGARPGSEGGMLKAMNSPYPLTGASGAWLKAKKQWDIDAEVLEVQRVKGTEAYNYLCILRKGEKAVPVGRTYNVRFEDEKGRPIQVPIGGIIRVAFGNLNRYTDARTGEVWYNWWSPRPVEYRKEKTRPDSTAVADERVEKSGGEVAEKPFPSRYKSALGRVKEGMIHEIQTDEEYLTENYPLLYDLDDYERSLLRSGMSEDDLSHARGQLFREAQEDGLYWDDFISAEKIGGDPSKRDQGLSDSEEERTQLREVTFRDIPPGGKTKDTVWQHHWRKAQSVHLDHRWSINDVLNGITIADQPEPGEVAATKKKLGMDPEDPVDTEEKARKLEAAIDWKFDPAKPEVKVVVFPKATQPPVWLDVKGKVDPGEVGATVEGPGFIHIVEKDRLMEFGTQKPFFHEYFEHGTRYKGRWLFRKIPARGFEKVGKGQLVWMAWWTKPDFESQIPYLLTRRGRTRRDYVPPDGVPGIPKEWADKVPAEMRWWTGKKSGAEKLDLMLQAFNHFAETMEKFPFRKLKEQRTARWALTRSWWKGPTVVRGMPRSRWELFLDLGGERLQVWEFEENPLFSDVVAGAGSTERTSPPGGKPKDWLTFEGEIPAAHKKNPNEEIPMSHDILDRGEATVIERTDDFIHLDMKGNRLKGRRVFKREEPKSTIWTFGISIGPVAK